MYKIQFDYQPRHDYPDEEHGSIELTLEQYYKLPKLSLKSFDEKCQFASGSFGEQIRHPKVRYPAIWISNESWKLESDKGNSFLNEEIRWVFVCLDVAKEIWIAFEFYDSATVAEAYCSTVGVSIPKHGDIYRLDDDCMAIVKKFYS